MVDPSIEAVESGSANGGGADDLDNLLAQFAAETARPADAPDMPAAETETPDGQSLEEILLRSERATLNAARDQFQNDYQKTLLQFQQAAHERDLPGVIKEVRGDRDPKVFSDEFVQTWIDNKARQSEALQQAWLNRAQDPQMWNAAQRQLAREFHSTFDRMIDENVTEDRDAVAAAVRGASSRAPSDPPVNYGSLSNAEFNQSVKEKYGFEPGV